MPDWLAIVLLGIIEGITEFLPVSSTGHLLIAQHWLPRQSDLFNIFIQSGAVVAVIPLFPERLRQVARCHRDPAARDFILKVLAAFALTGIGGVVLDQLGLKLPESIVPVALALIAGGVLFLVAERVLRGRPVRDEITWTVAAAVGLAQLVAAVFPGTSRSGATILVLLALGLSRPAATEFSFLVGIPTMLAAGGLKLAKAWLRPPPGGVTEDWGLLALGTIVSAIVSFMAVKWLLGYVRTHTFVGFGWYRIGAGALLLLLLLRG
ncbi:MAG: undecaprenyl-diphosphate phosphatase [Verrucomicrobia bacterium]|nr:undecaprenyl-diphosphate phosphatase [Verrucomicrobiota bacterium]